ncbi:hypothetical protein TWF694_008211 [Orbilia ellipsospora]|uniref:carboxypeptidase C n=1 Tax=Orbilia ellipsospora TaxID=2528407 RepID=A0AAV9XFY3_9PEZI
MRLDTVLFALFVPSVLAYLRVPHRQRPNPLGRDFFLSRQSSAGDHIQQLPLSFDIPAVIKQEKSLPNDPFPIDDPKGIRVQAVDERLCKSGSRQLTGHVNVTQDKSLFFWFHESKRDPKNDPLIIWLNGGPGASSLLGALTEIGPCLIDDDGMNTTHNPHPWSNFANLVFVDQPAGVGFSTVTNDSYLPYTMQDTTTDFSTFIRRLFKHVIPEFSSHKVHFIGQSFAGMYLPGILAKIIDQQQSLRELGMPDPFPKIESLVFADALVDWATNSIGLYRTTCVERPDETGVEGPILNETACELLSRQVPVCEKLGVECRLSMDEQICVAAMNYCDKMGDSFMDLTYAGERSPYDMRADCPDRISCLGYFEKRLDTYLNQPLVLDLLGLPNTTEYLNTNNEVNRRWYELANDCAYPAVPQITKILEETDTRVLVYNGNSDWAICTDGAIEWMNILPWSGNGEFRAKDFKPWEYTDDDGKKQKGGMMKQAKGGKLAFASIDKSGHLAPHDQPAALETLVKSWMELKFGSLVREQI